MDANECIRYWNDYVVLEKLEVEYIQEHLQITMRLRSENKLLHFRFIRALRLSMSELSAPATLGLRIVDNSFMGWDPSVRYTVEDFEDNQICFHCEDFEYFEEIMPDSVPN